jgi:hypothetical protein
MKSDTQTELTLASLDGIKRSQMPAELRERILATLPQSKGRIISLHKPFVLLMAAALALLIGFNVYTLAHQNKQAATEVAGADNPLANEYFSPAPSI